MMWDEARTRHRLLPRRVSPNAWFSREFIVSLIGKEVLDGRSGQQWGKAGRPSDADLTSPRLLCGAGTGRQPPPAIAPCRRRPNVSPGGTRRVGCACRQIRRCRRLALRPALSAAVADAVGLA